MQVICAEDCRSTAWTWCGQGRGPGVASGKRASLARVPAPPPSEQVRFMAARARTPFLSTPDTSRALKLPHSVTMSPSKVPTPGGSSSPGSRRGCSPAGYQVAASKRSEAAPGWRPLGTSTPRTATGQPLSCRGSPWTAEPGRTLHLQRSPGCS